MKASELRIGNWIRVYGLNPDGELKQIHSGDFGICELNPEIYEPIPLTEEWLLRFGINTWFLDGRFSIVSNEDGSFSVYAHANGRSVFIKHISYVHQLQNLYYALTGEELTINEGK